MINRGFTLIELLIVIAVLGVLAAGVLVAINPTDQLARGRDANRKTIVGQLSKALRAYYTSQIAYPPMSDIWINTLVNAGEIKTAPADSGTAPACITNAQNDYCLKTDTLDSGPEAILFVMLESSSENYKCTRVDPTSRAYFLWSSVNSRAGIICNSGDPTAVQSYENSFLGDNFNIAPTSSPRPMPTLDITPMPTPIPSPSPSPTPTPTPSPSPSPIPSPSPTPTPTPTPAPPSSDPVGWWKFDEGSGSTAADSAGTNNGLLNGPSWVTSSCRFNYCLSFSAQAQASVLLGSTGLPTENSDYSITVWIKPGSYGNHGIIGWGTSDLNQMNAFRMTDTGLMNYWWRNDLVVVKSGLTDGNWHHVAATFNGTTRSIYVDGTLVGSDTPGSDHSATAVDFRIGYSKGPGFFSGLIDDVRVYNTALSQTQIQNIYNGL